MQLDIFLVTFWEDIGKIQMKAYIRFKKSAQKMLKSTFYLRFYVSSSSSSADVSFEISLEAFFNVPVKLL